MFAFIFNRLLPLFLFIVSFYTHLFSQNNDYLPYLTSKDSIDKVYGMDPTLYNGILYQSKYPETVKGDQYFSSPEYLNGEVLIRGVIFKNIKLNYDVYKQEVLLKYTNLSNGINIISISKAWLESFTIGDDRFTLYGTAEIPKRIYQVFGNDSILLLYFWRKDLIIDNTEGVLAFIKKRESFVLMNNSLNKFKNNRSFLHLFPLDKQIQIKKYLRQHKIKVNKASNKTMEELIIFCSK